MSATAANEKALTRVLAQNLARRQRAHAELVSAREELVTLIRRGDELGVPRTRLAKLAQMNRRTFYDLLEGNPAVRAGAGGERGAV